MTNRRIATRRILPLLALGTPLLLLAFTATGAGAPEPARPTARPLPAEVLRATPASSYRIETAYTGELHARRRSALGFELAGLVVEVLADEGQVVESGQVLARIDARSIRARRAQTAASLAAETAGLQELERGARSERRDAASARVRELEAQLRLAEITLERRKGERSEGVASQSAVDESMAARDALAARLRGARADLDELANGTRPERIAAQKARVAALASDLERLDVDLDRCALRAPFAGRISRRLIDEGRVLQSGEPVLELVEHAQLEAHIGVPEQQTRQLSPSTTHSLQVGEERHSAHIRTILPDVDTQTRTVTVIFELDGADTLRPGQTARWLAPREVRTRGFWLPVSALSKGTRGLWTCFVLMPQEDDDAHRIERRELELLHTSGERAFVRGTLEADDLVVRSGTHRFVSGQRAVPAKEQN